MTAFASLDPVRNISRPPPDFFKVGVLGDTINRRWVAAKMEPHLPMMRTLKDGYWRQAKRRGYVQANQQLLEIERRLYRSDLRLSMDDYELRQWCQDKADQCNRAAAAYAPERAAQRVAAILAAYGLELPVKDDLFEPALARCADPAWWRRQVRRLQARECDEIARGLRLVHAGKQIYSSDFNVQRRQKQRARNRALMSEMVATNQAGQEYTIQELSDLSVSNPAIRRAELMTRIAGFEQVAKNRGLVAEFYTLTCPSKYHPMKKKGAENAKYAGGTVQGANNYLCGVWGRVRAAFKRRGVRVFGFRVVEPHHDGCPHWHFLLFLERGHVDAARGVFRSYALAEEGDEPGARDHRFKAQAIDWGRGTAAGYIAKYIAKNIDGHGLDDGHGGDLFGNDAVSSAQRIEAWASAHGIRQFQQIGGPSVTVWRELRRVRDELVEPEIEKFRAAADSADWAAYVEMMGGPFCGRDQAVKLERCNEMDLETGEIIDPVVNKYGEFVPEKIRGLSVVGYGVTVITRVWRWTVERVRKVSGFGKALIAGFSGGSAARSKQSFLPEPDFFDFQGAVAPPWSSVNNCTGPPYG